jgi:hypothetical protein
MSEPTETPVLHDGHALLTKTGGILRTHLTQEGGFKQRLLWRYLLVPVIVPPSDLRRPRWMLQSFRSGRAGSRD